MYYITGLIIHQSGTVFDITFVEDKDGVEGKRDTIGVTVVHPFYSLTAGDWVAAGDLRVGEKVLAKSGAAIVISSRKRKGIETVYNLEVKDWRNFLVGIEGVVVHNSCKWLLDILDTSDLKKQEKKLGKHAKDWGFSHNNYNYQNGQKFVKILHEFISNNAGKKYLTGVNYRGLKECIVVLEETTRKMVLMDANGKFITAYKMGENQVTQLLNDLFIY